MDRYSLFRLPLQTTLIVLIGFVYCERAQAQFGHGVLQPSCDCVEAVCGCEVAVGCDIPIETDLPTDCGCPSPLTCGCEIVCEQTCGAELVTTDCDVLGGHGHVFQEPNCGFVGEPHCGAFVDPGCGFEVLGQPLIQAPAVFNEPTCGCGRLNCSDLGCSDMGYVTQPYLNSSYSIAAPQCGCESSCDTACGGTGGLLAALSRKGWSNPFTHFGLFSWNRSVVGAPGPCSTYYTIDFGFASIWDDARSVGPITSALGGSPEYELDSGGLVRYGYGWDYCQFRVEAEVGFRRSSIDTGVAGTSSRAGDALHLKGYRRSTTYMFNGYYDLHNGSFFTPYLKGGLGVSRNRAQANYVLDANSAATLSALGLPSPSRFAGDYPRQGSTDFAWSLGVGLAATITNRVKFDVEYQYMDVGDAVTGTDGFGEALDFGDGGLHEVTFGLRFYR